MKKTFQSSDIQVSCLLEDSTPGLCGWRGNVLWINAVCIHAKVPCLVIWGSREKRHQCPGDLVSDLSWSCTASLLYPLLVSLLDALVPPGKQRPSLIRLTDADSLTQGYNKSSLLGHSVCSEYPDLHRLLVGRNKASSRPLQHWYIVLGLSIAFTSTSIILAALVCRWFSTQNRKSESGELSII